MRIKMEGIRFSIVSKAFSLLRCLTQMSSCSGTNNFDSSGASVDEFYGPKLLHRHSTVS